MSYKVIDIFCGAGGMSAGFKAAGFDIVMGIDNDSKAMESYSINFPKTKSFRHNIFTLSYNKDILPAIQNNPIDVIIGDLPYSKINLHSDLIKILKPFFKIVGKVKPKVFVLATPKECLSFKNYMIISNILKRASLHGFSCDFQLLNAKDFGVPSCEKKVFIVGYKTGKYNFPVPDNKIITCSEAISDLPSLENGNKKEKIIPYQQSPQNEFQKNMRKDSNEIHNHVLSRHNKRIELLANLLQEGQSVKELEEEVLPEGINKSTNLYWKKYRSDQPVNGIEASFNYNIHYKYPRLLTVREVARLRAVRDSFVFVGNKKEQYSQVGHMLSPLLAEHVARQVTILLRKTM